MYSKALSEFNNKSYAKIKNIKKHCRYVDQNRAETAQRSLRKEKNTSTAKPGTPN